MTLTKLLLVKENRFPQIAIEHFAEELGYEIIGLVETRESLFASTQTNHPGLVIFELNTAISFLRVEDCQYFRDEAIPIIICAQLHEEDKYNKIKELSPFAYLVAPFDKVALKSAIELAIINISYNGEASKNGNWLTDIILKDCFFIKSNNVLKKIMIKDVLWLESEGNYCTIYTNQKKFVIKRSLSKVIEQLPKAHFIQIHKSYVAQTGYIEDIDLSTGEVIIQKQRLPLGRKYRSVLVKRLNLL